MFLEKLRWRRIKGNKSGVFFSGLFWQTNTVKTITDGVFVFGLRSFLRAHFFVFATKPQHIHHQGWFYSRTFTFASGCTCKIWLRSHKTKEYLDFFNLCEVKFINIKSFTSIILSNYCLKLPLAKYCVNDMFWLLRYLSGLGESTHWSLVCFQPVFSNFLSEQTTKLIIVVNWYSLFIDKLHRFKFRYRKSILWFEFKLSDINLNNFEQYSSHTTNEWLMPCAIAVF